MLFLWKWLPLTAPFLEVINAQWSLGELTNISNIWPLLSLNEAFLDSAQIRGNAVSRARMLGYVPSSQLAPKATVNIVVDVTGETGTKPTNLALPRGTKLSTTVDGETFQFVTLSTQTATITNNLYTYNNVEIAGGSGVIRDIPENTKVMGYPAKNIREFLRDNKW